MTLLNAAAPVVLSSEMIANEPAPRRANYDPRQAKVFNEKVLNHRLSYAKGQRIVLCHATNKSGIVLACAIDHALDTSLRVTWKTNYTPDAGQVVASIDAEAGQPITLMKYIVYHTSHTAPPEEVCARAERTLDRAVATGFTALLGRPRTVHGRLLATKRRQGHDQSRSGESLDDGRPAGHPIQSVSCAASQRTGGKHRRARRKD